MLFYVHIALLTEVYGILYTSAGLAAGMARRYSLPRMDRKTCRICLVEHDEEIHAATISVHDWFHDQVTQGFHEEPEYWLVEEQEPELAPAR